MIAVLGAGESGVGAAILAKQKGFDVFVSDYGSVKENYKVALNKNNINWEEGMHDEARILTAELLIKSPGIPETALLKKARSKGINVLSEIEFAYRYCQGKIIAVTGSNGKTTTASLINYLLEKAGFDVALAGNYVAKPSNGWYCRVDTETGELVDPKVREKDTLLEDFWTPIFEGTDFKKFIKGMLKLLGKRFHSIKQIDTHHRRGNLISK